MFEVGKEYSRQGELHDVYGGNRQSGISASAQHPIVFLFSSPRGEEFGYKDGWISATEYAYTGEGTIGNMEMLRGNRVIRDHEEDGRALHLFKASRTARGYYEYVGEFQYVDHEVRELPDGEGRGRDAIVFRLRLMNTAGNP